MKFHIFAELKLRLFLFTWVLTFQSDFKEIPELELKCVDLGYWYWGTFLLLFSTVVISKKIVDEGFITIQATVVHFKPLKPIYRKLKSFDHIMIILNEILLMNV